MISVNSDSFSLLIRRNINKSSNRINTALERMATGYKINRAKDGAANLFICENLKTKIQSSNVLKSTASMNLDMLSTVESALQSLTDSLFRIRDLTLQQMNGYYDTHALNAITSEINSQIEQIVQITKSTNFNGKNLLDGTAKQMLVSLYDGASGLTGLNMDKLFEAFDFVDVFTGKNELYFVDAQAGKTYYADFDGKIYSITSDIKQQITYRYDSDAGQIEFIDSKKVKAVELGAYKNDYASLGNGEKYLQINANKSSYVKSGNKVYEIKNTNAISQIAIYKDDGAGGLDIVSGEGVQKTLLYDLDSYKSVNSGQALKLTAGSSQHLIFANKLYEISSTKNQTLIFNNKNNNLNVLAGSDGVTVKQIGNMGTITQRIAAYVELNANETKYYEYGGNIYQITNNKTSKQNFIIDSSNNVKDANGNVVRTQLLKADMKNFSSYTNLQKMNVTAGQSYYLENADGRGVTKITANQTGTLYFDKTTSGFDKFQGVSTSVSTINKYEKAALNSSNQFTLTVNAGETKAVSVNNQIYTIQNSTGSAFTRTFEYDSGTKSVKEVLAPAGNFTNSVRRINEEEAIANGYVVVKTAADLSKSGTKFILMNDIDLAGSDVKMGDFNGIFDGNGYSIKNANFINGGFFGTIGSSAQIKNLGIENAELYLHNNENDIGFFGSNNYGKITNCFASGDIVITPLSDGIFSRRVGGLVGTNYGEINFCSFKNGTISASSSISSNHSIGGITGSNFSGASIKNSYVSGVIDLTNFSSSYGIGGITALSAGLISDCYFDGTIITNTALLPVTGGIAGPLEDGNLNNCYVTGSLNGADAIVGYTNPFPIMSEISNSFWDTDKTGSTTGCNPSYTTSNVKGLTTAELADSKVFTDAGWDSSVWDFSTPPPSFKDQTASSIVNGSYLADFSSSTSHSAAGARYLDNFSGTAYIKSGNDIYEIKNNGTAQDVLFNYDNTTGALTALNAPNIDVKKVNQASFVSLNSSNFSTILNPGESKYWMFTIGGVQRTFKVTNNSSDKQSAVFEKTNTISLKSGQGVVLEEYTDMVKSTEIKDNSFYVDFAGSTKKNININGHFYEITNPDGNTALFRINGNEIVQYAGNSTSHITKEESGGINTSNDQYTIELNPNETRYIKINDSAYEIKNNTGVKQTDIFNIVNDSLNNINANITSRHLSLTNTPSQQMLIKTDWAIDEVTNRRAMLGSYYNVISASVNRNTSLAENLTAAKSTLMDADFAQESALLVKNRILQNVSASLLYQAGNVHRNIVLGLL